MSDEEDNQISEEKEIKLYHNTYKVVIKIKKKYDDIKQSIKDSLYLTEEDYNNLQINFLDADGDENILEEDTFEDAYNAKEWVTSKKVGTTPGKQEQNNNTVSKEEIKKMKNNIYNKCAKIIEKKIKETNDKWKKKFEELNNKFQDELKKRETLNKKTLEEIIDKMSNEAKDMVENRVNDYNNNIKELLKSKLEQSKIDLNNEKKNITQALDEITNTQKEIKEKVDGSKITFSKVMDLSAANINNK